MASGNAIAHRANAQMGAHGCGASGDEHDQGECSCGSDHVRDQGGCAGVYQNGRDLCSLGLRRTARSRPTNKFKPIAATIPPETKLKMGNNRSGTT